MPVRIQQRRTKGWRKPENTVSVARPSVWGNPFVVGVNAMDRAEAVEQYRDLVMDAGPVYERFRARARETLGGKNLMCFCPLDQPCHADVLLELANGDGA